MTQLPYNHMKSPLVRVIRNMRHDASLRHDLLATVFEDRVAGAVGEKRAAAMEEPRRG